ncbi:unnamed protein product [Vitrella brassicaformis CCMP3155]|uniref:Uncharacterized protein n=2 Tax=Vitrella brassicaformis TaxID=1169539 RepID=A0A0G4EV44_VITBC|nr:unnamed protein product [Vitrella brassicaformis CCMP3155]|eukprot:CEM02481.1 unnamed protein product [Vitrella brassicaformis CCMP3155]
MLGNLQSPPELHRRFILQPAPDVAPAHELPASPVLTSTMPLMPPSPVRNVERGDAVRPLVSSRRYESGGVLPLTTAGGRVEFEQPYWSDELPDRAKRPSSAAADSHERHRMLDHPRESLRLAGEAAYRGMHVSDAQLGLDQDKGRPLTHVDHLMDGERPRGVAATGQSFTALTKPPHASLRAAGRTVLCSPTPVRPAAGADDANPQSKDALLGRKIVDLDAPWPSHLPYHRHSRSPEGLFWPPAPCKARVAAAEPARPAPSVSTDMASVDVTAREGSAGAGLEGIRWVDSKSDDRRKVVAEAKKGGRVVGKAAGRGAKKAVRKAPSKAVKEQGVQVEDLTRVEPQTQPARASGTVTAAVAGPSQPPVSSASRGPLIRSHSLPVLRRDTVVMGVPAQPSQSTVLPRSLTPASIPGLPIFSPLIQKSHLNLISPARPSSCRGPSVPTSSAKAAVPVLAHVRGLSGVGLAGGKSAVPLQGDLSLSRPRPASARSTPQTAGKPIQPLKGHQTAAQRLSDPRRSAASVPVRREAGQGGQSMSGQLPVPQLPREKRAQTPSDRPRYDANRRTRDLKAKAPPPPARPSTGGPSLRPPPPPPSSPLRIVPRRPKTTVRPASTRPSSAPKATRPAATTKAPQAGSAPPKARTIAQTYNVGGKTAAEATNGRYPSHLSAVGVRAPPQTHKTKRPVQGKSAAEEAAVKSSHKKGADVGVGVRAGAGVGVPLPKQRRRVKRAADQEDKQRPQDRERMAHGDVTTSADHTAASGVQVRVALPQPPVQAPSPSLPASVHGDVSGGVGAGQWGRVGQGDEASPASIETAEIERLLAEIDNQLEQIDRSVKNDVAAVQQSASQPPSAEPGRSLRHPGDSPAAISAPPDIVPTHDDRELPPSQGSGAASGQAGESHGHASLEPPQLLSISVQGSLRFQEDTDDTQGGEGRGVASYEHLEASLAELDSFLATLRADLAEATRDTEPDEGRLT